MICTIEIMLTKTMLVKLKAISIHVQLTKIMQNVALKPFVLWFIIYNIIMPRSPNHTVKHPCASCCAARERHCASTVPLLSVYVLEVWTDINQLKYSNF